MGVVMFTELGGGGGDIEGSYSIATTCIGRHTPHTDMCIDPKNGSRYSGVSIFQTDWYCPFATGGSSCSFFFFWGGGNLANGDLCQVRYVQQTWCKKLCEKTTGVLLTRHRGPKPPIRCFFS